MLFKPRKKEFKKAKIDVNREKIQQRKIQKEKTIGKFLISRGNPYWKDNNTNRKKGLRSGIQTFYWKKRVFFN